jgi:FKBP-type peptidyl-prolyl cis-trans isomerase
MSRLNVLLILLAVAVGCGPPPEPEVSNTRMEPGPVDADAAEEFTVTESGLRYRIRRKSPDGVKPGPQDNVRVHYKGWLDKGIVFDTSYGKRPMSLDVHRFVPGFGEGLQLIGTGGMIELEIPARLGYGARGQGKIPPNATLHFVVELEEVVPAPVVD